jgi:hypothetical protein
MRSINQEILGWSPNDILDQLKKIPNCKSIYSYTHFVFRDGDSHEICSLENIKDGDIKSSYAQDSKVLFELDKEQEYHFMYSFNLEFGNLTGTENYLLFDKGEEKETQESIPLSKITKIFTDIENSITSLRSDFFIHLYYEKPLELHNLFIDLEFTSKDMAEKEYIIR